MDFLTNKKTGEAFPIGSSGVSSSEFHNKDSDVISTGLEQVHLKENDEIINYVKNNFKKILEKTAEDHKDCVSRLDGLTLIYSDGTPFENYCGNISYNIAKTLKDKMKINSQIEDGIYIGDGYENSADFVKGDRETGHVWVRLSDGTIIDGSYGQFRSKDQRKTVDDKLLILKSDDPRQSWYITKEIEKI